MKIITISGSARSESGNTKLLKHLWCLSTEITFHHSDLPKQLPLFNAELQDAPAPEVVKRWKEELRTADGIIFCIPEYIHNMPAMIKNALEWITASGELAGKKVLAVSSGGAISMAISQILHAPSETVIELNLQQKNSGYAHFYFNQHTIRLTGMNYSPHLDTPERIQHLTFS